MIISDHVTVVLTCDLFQNAQLRLGVKPSGPGSSASVAGVTVGPVGAGVVAVSGLGGPSSSYCYC